MSEIKHILLVPEKGDPHGLLAEGPCGARPPIAYIPNRGWKWTEGPCAEEFPNGRALVLKWGGTPVAEGMDRAARVDPHYRGEAWASSRALGREMERLGYGTLVLIDAEGREVIPRGWPRRPR